MISCPVVIAVMGYESCYGAEKANLQVLSLLRESRAVVHCLVRSDGTGEKFIRLATERGFTVHPAGFGPSIFGLHGNVFQYLSNATGMVKVSLSLVMLRKQVGATHIYVPNYLQFLYCWPALLLLRLPVVFRIGDPPEKSSLHRHLWTKIIAPCVSQFVTNSEFTRQRLLSVCGRPIRSRVIKNCIAQRGVPLEALPEPEQPPFPRPPVRPTPFSPPSGPAQRLFQEHPAKSKFLAATRYRLEGSP